MNFRSRDRTNSFFIFHGWFYCHRGNPQRSKATTLTNERSRHRSHHEGAAPTGGGGGASPVTVPRSRGPRATATSTPSVQAGGAGGARHPKFLSILLQHPPLPQDGRAPLRGDRRRKGVGGMGASRGYPGPQHQPHSWYESRTWAAAPPSGRCVVRGQSPKGFRVPPHWGGGST